MSQGKGRGQMTDAIRQLSRDLLGYEITVTELRLMPYIINVMMNNQVIDISKIMYDEHDVLIQWRAKGYIDDHNGKLVITSDFWITCCSLVYLGYVDL